MRKIQLITVLVVAVVGIISFSVFVLASKENYEMNIAIQNVTKAGSGWYVENEDKDYFLDKKAMKGLQQPEVGKSVNLVLDKKDIVLKWKVKND